jgi:protein phosphatase
MMAKIALISDIHGNLPALEAVCSDIRRRGIKRILCLGDLVGKGPQPAETVDLIREVCEVTLQGNWDHKINQPQEKESVIWHQERLGPDRLQYLNELPFSYDLQLSGKWIRLLHASAQGIYHRVNRNASKKEKRGMFEHTELTGFPNEEQASRHPDVVGYGDIHVPYIQMLKSKEKKGLYLFNIGSVGAPYDGIPQASYAILEGKPDVAAEAPFSIALIRVPYDIERAIRSAEQANLPDLERYCYEVRSGLEQ